MIRLTFAAVAVIAGAAIGIEVMPSGAVSAASPTQAAPGETVSGIVTPVFCERKARVTRPRNLKRARMVAVDEEVSSVACGTAFAIDTGGRVLLVTAAHVVRLPSKVDAIVANDGTTFDSSDGETKIEPAASRVRVGGISARPTRILVDESLDVVLIELDPADFRALGIATLSPGETSRDAEVKLWGFPAIPRADAGGKPLPPAPSASQTSQRSDVTDVRGTEVICTMLNGIETRGGFSGGAVVDAQGKVVGMIMRSTPETTRCRSMRAIGEMAKDFDAKAQPCN